MEPIVGREYKTTKHPSINERFRDRALTVLEIRYEYIHVRFNGDRRYRTIPRDKWNIYVKDGDGDTWYGNILKFHFT